MLCVWFFGLSAFLGCGIKRVTKALPGAPQLFHEVVSGDTLSGIAACYGTDVGTLVGMNRLKDPDLLKVGDRILIPAGCRKRGDTVAASRALAKGIPGVGQGLKSQRAKKGALCFPVTGVPVVTSGFGPRWGKMHRGMDFSAPVGSTVCAAHNGEVVHVGKDGKGPGRSYGNYLVMHHGNGLYTLYAHLHAVHVKEGQRVKSKQKIGEVGNTGRSTGPHLHFEVIEGVVEVDPATYLPEA